MTSAQTLAEQNLPAHWKQHPQLGNYDVSNDGLVRNRTTGRVLAPRIARGYHLVSPHQNGQRFDKSAHRMVLETFVGPCPEGHEAGHLNGNRTDNRVENLAWITCAENARQRVEHGTQIRGARVNHSKLTQEQVDEIRAQHAAGVLHVARTAVDLGVTRRAIYLIINGRSWTR